MLTPLELLNLYLTDGKSKGNVTSELYQKFNRELTWDALLNEGYQQDLAPMLYYIITKTNTLSDKRYAPSSSPDALCAMPHAPCQVSPEIMDKLKSLYNQYLVTNMVQFKELDTILDAFEKEGIDVIQLKGAWIAKNYYPDPALRPMGDLDLLVRKEDMKRAKERLVSLGYEFVRGPSEKSYEKRHFHFPYVKHSAMIPTAVELHWDIRAKSDFIKSNILEFWEHALPINKNYKHVLKIPKEYLLLHLFWHTYLNLSRHLNMRVIWFLDITNVIKKYIDDIDWILVKEKANKWEIQKRVYFCLSLITQLLHMDFNQKIMERLMPSQNSVKLFNFIMLRKEKDTELIDSNCFLIIVLNLIALNTFSEKLQYFLRYESKKLLTKKERVKRRYNLLSKIPIYLFYIFHSITFILKLLKGAFKIFWQGQKLTG